MRQTSLLCLFAFQVLLWGALGSAVRAEHPTIETALLIVGDVEREVSLPHTLGPSDFEPDGSTVIYRIKVDLPADAEGLQAVYIPKLSLSGRILRNGQAIWACGAAELSELRCLHRPHLIQLPAGFLAPGSNVLDLEIYADSRQMSGLSPVTVGPYEELLQRHFRFRHFLKVDLVRALAIVAALTGLLSLVAGLTTRPDLLFFVFAAAAIVEALGTFIVLAVDPFDSRRLTSWLVFTTLYVSALLKVLLFYEAFGRLKPRDPIVAYVVFLIVLGPIAFAMTDSQRSVISFFHLLGIVGMTVTVARMLHWTYCEPSLSKILWTVAGAIILLSSLHDSLRVTGAAQFDGVFALLYIFPVLIFIMGLVLFAQMGKGLRLAQDFSQSLNNQVAERTLELQSALTSIQSLEESALRLTRNIPVGTFILKTWGRERARYAFFSDRLRKMIALPDGADPPFFSEGEKLLHPDDGSRSRVALRHAIDYVTPVEAEFRIRSPEGNWRWLRWIMLPQAESTMPVVWDGVVIDVTEAREAEERLHIANAGLVKVAADQSRIAERDRLLQDMHDGFGSNLSSARLALEHGGLDQDEVARVLLECSQDLQIMVDTLSNEDGRLSNALSDFRYRTERRLLGTGISISWEIAFVENICLPPTIILQILRVLQEAMNNALRHSGARRLTVSVVAGRGELKASVSDDGCGITDHTQRGRGLANMRRRCREIEARLEITDNTPGTMVALTMDMPDGD